MTFPHPLLRLKSAWSHTKRFEKILERDWSYNKSRSVAKISTRELLGHLEWFWIPKYLVGPIFKVYSG